MRGRSAYSTYISTPRYNLQSRGHLGYHMSGYLHNQVHVNTNVTYSIKPLSAFPVFILVSGAIAGLPLRLPK